MTYTSGQPLHTIDSHNEDALEKLISDFPSLTVALHWRQDVAFSPNDAEKNHDDYGRPGLYWDATSTLNLHRIAAHMLGELVRTEDPKRVLRASPSSIRGIHSLAIG